MEVALTPELETLIHQEVPCNVLVPMTQDGRLGFGHLRYQEYLVACELAINRHLEIAPLVGQDWRGGALILFSKINDSIEWLVKDLALKERLDSCRDAVNKLVEVRPLSEQRTLRFKYVLREYPKS